MRGPSSAPNSDEEKDIFTVIGLPEDSDENCNKRSARSRDVTGEAPSAQFLGQRADLKGQTSFPAALRQQ